MGRGGGPGDGRAEEGGTSPGPPRTTREGAPSQGGWVGVTGGGYIDVAPPPCISYANVHNYYSPYTCCSLDKGVACA